MRIVARSFILSITLLAIICGCCTNPDPAKGGFYDGIFCRQKYKDRQEKRKVKIDEIQKSNIALDQEYLTLKEKNQTVQQMRQIYAKDLDKLKNEINQLESQLIRAEAKNAEGENQKRKLMKELVDLKEKIDREKIYIDTISKTQMRDELTSLINEKRRLQNQILKLTSW